MKAAIIHRENGTKVLRTDDIPDPECGPAQVVVRVRNAGICGSDVHGFLDPISTARTEGLIMSHEAAGEIAAVGSDVSGWVVGNRVTVDPQVTCGVCGPCRNGWISICDNKRVTGSSLHGFQQGAMAEYLAVHAKQVCAVPDRLSYAEAAAIEPLANALHVIRRAEPANSDVVVVLGMGPLGLCLLQCLKATGVGTVVATDLADHRLAAARTLGADHTVNVGADDLTTVVRQLTSGSGADIVIEAVGIDVTYWQAIDIVRKRGKIMFFGAVQDTVTMPLLSILHKEITIIGCTGANDETPDAVRLVAERAVDLASIITHRFSLDAAQRAIETMCDPEQHAIKVQVLPQELHA